MAFLKIAFSKSYFWGIIWTFFLIPKKKIYICNLLVVLFFEEKESIIIKCTANRRILCEFFSLSFSLFLCFVMHVYLLNVLNPHNAWFRAIILKFINKNAKKNLKLGSVFLFKILSSIIHSHDSNVHVHLNQNQPALYSGILCL